MKERNFFVGSISMRETREIRKTILKQIYKINLIDFHVHFLIQLFFSFLENKTNEMAEYSGPPSVNPYWYYDPHGYQPNVSVSFNTNISG